MSKKLSILLEESNISEIILVFKKQICLLKLNRIDNSIMLLA